MVVQISQTFFYQCMCTVRGGCIWPFFWGTPKSGRTTSTYKMNTPIPSIKCYHFLFIKFKSNWKEIYLHVCMCVLGVVCGFVGLCCFDCVFIRLGIIKINNNYTFSYSRLTLVCHKNNNIADFHTIINYENNSNIVVIIIIIMIIIIKIITILTIMVSMKNEENQQSHNIEFML